MNGRDIILKGAYWKVLSGRNVSLLRDVWVPNLSAGHPIPINDGSVDLDQTVDLIINQDAGSWNLTFIANVISELDSTAIVGSHFGDPARSDYLIWQAKRNGIYTIKSGYRWVWG